MRLHRFFVTEVIDNKKEITIHSTVLVHQVRNVFRLKVGDCIIIFNGTGFDYECKIDSFVEGNKIQSDSAIRLQIKDSSLCKYSPSQRLILCAALVKKDTFEWIVEKATELGVTDIIPVLSDRSEKKSLNESRLRKIAIEASEQSGRGTTPMVHTIMGSGEAIIFLKKEMKEVSLWAFHTEGEKIPMSDIGRNSPLAVFIGPEGGWSPEELEMFHNNNITVVCLGPQVLRAETAVVAALSLCVFAK